jgi:anti-anti-sigma factor
MAANVLPCALASTETAATGSAAAATQRLLYEQSAGARQLVIDLSAVGYVNSAGLRVLLDAGQRHQSVGGRMILCAVPSYIKEVLDMAGLTSLFPVYATRKEAMAAAEAAE